MRARTLVFACLSLSVLMAAVVSGCSGDNAKPLGTLGAACYADNRCNAQLTCVGNVCIQRGPGGTAPSDGGTDAAGQGGAAGGAGGKSGAVGGAGGGAGGAAGADGGKSEGPADGGTVLDGGADTRDGAAPTDAGATDGPADGDGGDA